MCTGDNGAYLLFLIRASESSFQNKLRGSSDRDVASFSLQIYWWNVEEDEEASNFLEYLKRNIQS